MLRLQIHAPLYLIFKFVVVLLQHLHGVRVGHAGKIGIHHMLEALQQALIDELVAECDVIRAGVEHIADDVLDHCFRELHVILQIGKCDLGLNHPELGGMALRVGTLRAERGAKGVNLAESLGHALRFQLAGNGEGRALLEEVLAVIHRAVLVLRHVVQVKRGYMEHLTRALAVAAGDDGRVRIDKAVLLEKLVEGKRGGRTHAERRAERVGARTQMRNRAQEFQRMALLLQRIIRRRRAFERNLLCMDFKGLLHLGGKKQFTRNNQGGSNVRFRDLFEIGELRLLKDDLHTLEAASVVEVNKTERLGIADCADPAAYRDLLAPEFFRSLVELPDFCPFHW